jgi:aspartyl-tRNA(Asn)/glutamyl-tRNA(Gln) amidotransferase subunit C
MASEINKEELKHLAKLSRIELSDKEEEKLLKDLDEILDYFKEIKSLDTSKVTPMTGGTELKNVAREDDEREKTNSRCGVENFPETKDGALKVPSVFE